MDIEIDSDKVYEAIEKGVEIAFIRAIREHHPDAILNAIDNGVYRAMKEKELE